MSILAMRLQAAAFAVAVGLAATATASAADGDATAGQRVFGRCVSCHAITPGKNGTGPSLAHVFGEHSGAVEGYNYSPALKKADVVWDEASLDKFLQSPNAFVRGTKMFVGVANAQDRSNVIAYLKSLSP
jgi:cytochrome c